MQGNKMEQRKKKLEFEFGKKNLFPINYVEKIKQTDKMFEKTTKR